jgi:hypothetical protein
MSAYWLLQLQLISTSRGMESKAYIPERCKTIHHSSNSYSDATSSEQSVQ